MTNYAPRAKRSTRASSNGVGELTQDDLDVTLCYTSAVRPGERKYETWLAVTHFFNHQTHHRGQLTTLLSQFGKEYGVTDLMWLLQVLERNAG